MGPSWRCALGLAWAPATSAWGRRMCDGTQLRIRDELCIFGFYDGQLFNTFDKGRHFCGKSPGAGVTHSGAPAAFGHLVETIDAMVRGSIGGSSFLGYTARVILIEICPAAR